VERISKRVERLSEALKYAKVPSKKAAYQELNRMQAEVQEQLKSVKKQVESAQVRGKAAGVEKAPATADEIQLGQKLALAKVRDLKSAEESQRMILSNAAVLQQQAEAETSAVGQQAAMPQQSAMQQQATMPQQVQAAAQPPQAPQGAVAAPKPPPPAPMVQFPRVGDVYTFGQRQATGKISFHYALKEMSARNWDLLLWALLMAGLALVAMRGSALVSSRRRIGAVLAAACIIAIAFGAALDIAVPGAAIGILLMIGRRRQPAAA
jgi:hypothetical protein